MDYAPRTSRLIGQILDGFVAAAPVLLASILFAFSDTVGGLAILVSMLWAIGYLFFADGMQDGQSLGKKWIGIAVVDSDTRRPCTWGQSFVRNILLSILGPIDWVFIFGERHQRLGDKVAGTIVVNLRGT